MKLLILGGTRFVGRHIVEAALARDHEVSLFNRGQTADDLFPDLEKLRGDRDGELDALRDRQWDAVIDMSGYIPRHVRDSAMLLADNVEHYVFISSVSAYASLAEPGLDESAPLATLEDETVEEITGETYGGLKALCERAAENAMPGRVLKVRPGFVVGPHDHSDRLTSWIHRVAQGGEVMVPWSPDEHFQFIDGRDLGEWVIRMTEDKQTGEFTTTGPDYDLTMRTFFETCREVSGSDATFTWISREFLEANGLEGDESVPLWSTLPFWSTLPGLFYLNCEKAFSAGLTFRPLEETIGDTLAWARSRPSDYEWKVGLDPERERKLLDAYRNAAS